MIYKEVNDWKFLNVFQTEDEACQEISRLDGNDEMERYCHEHVTEKGFCYCGIFCAGIESFDFGRYRGFCDNCADEIKANEARDEMTEMEQGLWEVDPYAAEYKKCQ